MKEKILVTTTTFPRWANDSTPRFVYDLSEKLALSYKIIVLAPHYNKSKKHEILGKLGVKRFVYFKPEILQKLCYDGGIIPNIKKSFIAKIQLPFLILSEFFASYGIIKKENIDMIHAHWMFPQGFIGVFLKKLFKIPLIVTIHGSDLFALKNAVFEKMRNFVVKNADYITVNSIATKKELITRFPHYSSKIKTIPMGVDISLFRKRYLKKPKKYANNRILLSVGRLSDQKGLQYMIKAMATIIKYDPKARLLIIGEGPYKKTLRKMIDGGQENNINFLGPMPMPDIARYYNYADIFIMPSLSTKTGTEALGLSLLEAMSSGCTVMGTKVGGIPFIIKNGYNGLLVNQKDSNSLSSAILTLLKDKRKSQIFGKRAAEFVRKNYSWEKISKEFIKLYADLLK